MEDYCFSSRLQIKQKRVLIWTLPSWLACISFFWNERITMALFLDLIMLRIEKQQWINCLSKQITLVYFFLSLCFVFLFKGRNKKHLMENLSIQHVNFERWFAIWVLKMKYVDVWIQPWKEQTSLLRLFGKKEKAQEKKHHQTSILPSMLCAILCAILTHT